MKNPAPDTTLREFSVEEFLPHSPEIIWKAMTIGELMKLWLMEPTGFEAVVGQGFTFKTEPRGEWDGTIHCKVLEIIPLRKLVFSWKGGHEANVGYGAPLDTVVTWTLTEKEGGTLIKIVHSGFVLPRNDSALQTIGEGWKQKLPQIVKAIH